MLITPEMQKTIVSSMKDFFNPSAETMARMKRVHEAVQADPEYQRLLQQLAEENAPHPFCRTTL